MVIDKDRSSQISQENHQWFFLAALVSSQNYNDSILSQFLRCTVDGEASNRFSFFFNHRLYSQHPIAEIFERFPFMSDIEDDS
jgi:hypothetical protein